MRITTAGLACRSGRYLAALRKPGSSIGESWEFPGGKNRRGETPEITLQREFLEELGLRISVGSLRFETVFTNQGQKYLLKAYHIDLLEEQPVLHEHQQIGWFLPGELLELPLADSDRAIASFLSRTDS